MHRRGPLPGRRRDGTVEPCPAAGRPIDGVKANLTAIKKDVQQIADAQGDLSPDRKQQVQKANDAFKAQVSGVAQSVVTGALSGGGVDQIKSAVQGLTSSYQTALAPIKCD